MLRIAFLGTPEFTLPLLEVCARLGELVCVVAQPDRPVGRSGTPQAPPSKRWAEGRGVPVAQPLKVKNGALAALLAEHAPDVAIVAAYGRILPKDALQTPRLGCLNVHASLLPKLRGAAPAQWAIAQGFAETGVTLMQMDEGLDTGDMLLQRALPVAPDETGESLLIKLGALGAEVLAEGLSLLEQGKLVGTPQNHARGDAGADPDPRRRARRVDPERAGNRCAAARLLALAGGVHHARGRAGQAPRERADRGERRAGRGRERRAGRGREDGAGRGRGDSRRQGGHRRALRRRLGAAHHRAAAGGKEADAGAGVPGRTSAPSRVALRVNRYGQLDTTEVLSAPQI